MSTCDPSTEADIFNLACSVDSCMLRTYGDFRKKMITMDGERVSFMYCSCAREHDLTVGCALENTVAMEHMWPGTCGARNVVRNLG